VLPAYRSKFSQHRVTQPQRFAILCLMRYEDRTSRQTEVRLAEHREPRAALGVRGVPDYTTLYRFLRRLDEVVVEETLSDVSRCWPPADAKRRATVAVDATGLTPGAISTFFVKRIKDQDPGFTWCHWVEWTMAIEVDRRLIVAQTARRGPTHDGATLRPLIDAAHRRVPLGLADAEFDRERTRQHLRTALQVNNMFPAKLGGADRRMQGVRAQMRRDCPCPDYGQRALIESVISAVTRQLSTRAPGRALHAMLAGVTAGNRL
jgi:hypothetical protein